MRAGLTVLPTAVIPVLAITAWTGLRGAGGGVGGCVQVKSAGPTEVVRI